jgi:outer membrane PBP1 activator LpoA protein
MLPDHWQVSYHFLDEAPEQEAARRARFAAMGIDAWVLAQDFRPAARRRDPGSGLLHRPAQGE